MEIFYRIYPGTELGNAERPYFKDDKLSLAYVCLLSFVESCAAANEQPRLTILMDDCPASWEDMVRSVVELWDFDHVHLVSFDGIGNQPSFRHQLDLACGIRGRWEDIIYFAEDDYLYREEAVREMCRFAREHVDRDYFWTPYDHPDRYTRDDDRDGRATFVDVVGKWTELADGTWDHKGCHWRKLESTCMTFGGPRRLFADNADLLRTHACTGRYLWYPLIDEGYSLWGPIPALATHVRDAYQSMCVDWRKVLKGVLAKRYGVWYSDSGMALNVLIDAMMKDLEKWR